MTFKKLKDLKPHLVDINSPGRPDPRFRGVKVKIPAKWVGNTRSSMDLMELYTKGPLKGENIGRVCGNCMNYYPERPGNAPSHVGRCMARGYIQVHDGEPADDVDAGWTDPRSGLHIKPWYGCPLYNPRERLSRR